MTLNLTRKLTALIIITSLVAGYFMWPTETESASQWVEIEVNPTKVPGDLTDFPVYIDLSDLPAAFWNTTNCTDIRMFKSDGTTELPREIVSCTDNGSSGTGELHVKYDGTLSSTATTTMQLHYDGSSSDYAVGATYGRNNVWTNGYEAVYHMQEDPSGTAPQMTDSTGNGNDGTSSGSMASGDLLDAQIEKGIDFDGGDDYINIGDVSGLDNKSTLTLSLWMEPAALSDYDALIDKVDDSDNRTQLLLSGSGQAGSDDVQFQYYNGGIQGAAWTTGNFISTATWYFIAAVFDNSGATLADRIKIFIDADSKTLSDTGGNFTGNTASLTSDAQVGASSFNSARNFQGIFDEVRISNVARSANYFTTTYNNQNSPSTFYFVSGEQTGGETPPVQTMTVSGDIRLSGGLILR